jgi:hypothetical protein
MTRFHQALDRENTRRKSHVHRVKEKDDLENASKIRVSRTFLLSWRQKLPFSEVIRQREVLEDAIDDTAAVKAGTGRWTRVGMRGR